MGVETPNREQTGTNQADTAVDSTLDAKIQPGPNQPKPRRITKRERILECLADGMTDAEMIAGVVGCNVSHVRNVRAKKSPIKPWDIANRRIADLEARIDSLEVRLSTRFMDKAIDPLFLSANTGSRRRG